MEQRKKHDLGREMCQASSPKDKGGEKTKTRREISKVKAGGFRGVGLTSGTRWGKGRQVCAPHTSMSKAGVRLAEEGG